MFDSAIYTDVLADEAIDGRSGFNFESVSAGFTATDQVVARDLMLHTATVDADLDITESYCHRAVGHRFYFSRGRDLGLTANGRGGNQLTEVVVTGDVEDLGPINPAQLYGARNWRLQKWGSRVAPQWPALPELDADFGIVQLLEWVRSDPARWGFLPEVVTALEACVTRQSSLPVVLVDEDLTTVLRWLSLGYQLLNADAVRSLSFRGFETDPARVGTDVVACRPRDAARFAHMTVVDLTTCASSGRTPSFAVERSLELLESLDVFTALEVITLARRWDPWTDQRLAFWGAEMVLGTLSAGSCVPDGQSVLTLVESLAEAGLVDDLAQRADTFASGLRSAGSDGDALRLVRAACRILESPQGDVKLAEILIDLSLSCVLRQPDMVGPWSRTLAQTQGNPWPGTLLRARWAECLTDLAQSAEDAELLPLFLLAGHLRPELPEKSWQRPTDRLARHLVSHPADLPRTGGLWNVGSLYLAMVRELVGRLDDQLRAAPGPLGNEGEFRRLRHGEFQTLTDAMGRTSTRGDVTRLAQWVAAARLSLLEPKRRTQHLPQLRSSIPASLWPAALAGSSPRSDGSLWVAWIRCMGAEEALLDHVARVIEDDLSRPASRELKDWRTLLDVLEHDPRKPVARRFTSLRSAIEDHLEQRDTAARRIARWMPALHREEDTDSLGPSH